MNFLFKVVNAASPSTDSVINSIVPKIVANIVLPLVQLLFAFTFLVFVWGLIGFFMGGDDTTKKEEGKQHILWGVIGIAIMVSVYGIIRLVAATVGQPSPF